MDRNDYLNGKVTHQEYYTALVDAIGREPIEGLVRGIVQQSTANPTDWMEMLKRSLNADENLNNIPLRLWDSRHALVLELIRYGQGRAVMAITHPQDTEYKGTFVWSLSDTVSCLKCAARRMVETQEEV